MTPTSQCRGSSHRVAAPVARKGGSGAAGAVESSADAAEAEASLLAAYPDAGLTIAAGLGTKVAKGEMTWG